MDILDKNDINYLHLCTKCNILKPNSEYTVCKKKRSFRKFVSSCKECRSKINNTWVKNNREKANNYQREYTKNLSKEEKYIRYKKNTKNNYIPYMFHTLKWNAKKRNLDVFIDSEYVMELYNIQNKRCYYTGDLMSLEQGDVNVISVDRLDSSKHYSKDNVVLCIQKVNIVKNDLTYDAFIELCKKVIIYDKERK